jgi:hypothetical protein
MSTTTARAPYEIGDKFSALNLEDAGTVLRTFTVTECFPKGRFVDGRPCWEVHGVGGGHHKWALVRPDGTDRNGYVERAS